MSRYVDLDEKVTAQFYDEECEEWTKQIVTIECVLDSVCDDYTVLPSVDAVPVKRRKWDDIGGIIRWGCPFCHHANDVKTNFCPNCGTDMRGDKDEQN